VLHVVGDLPDVAGLILHQEETDDLENLFVAGPGASIDVLNVGQLDYGTDAQAGFFANFTDGSFERLLPGVDVALGQRNRVFAVFGLAFPAGFDRGHPPLLLHVAQDDRAGGEFTGHEIFTSVALTTAAWRHGESIFARSAYDKWRWKRHAASVENRQVPFGSGLLRIRL